MSLRQTRTTYHHMIARCYKPEEPGYDLYGGRGIKVCKRWRSGFKFFLEDMGIRPPGMTLDRINGKDSYKKNNCKWSTKSEQALNRSTTREWGLGVHVFQKPSVHLKRSAKYWAERNGMRFHSRQVRGVLYITITGTIQ